MQNVVNDCKPLRKVKVTEQVGIAQGQPTISYEQYVVLLRNAASTYDLDVKTSHHYSSSFKMSANVHNDGRFLDHVEADEIIDDFNTMTVDDETQSKEVPSYSVYETSYGNGRSKRRPSLPRSVWYKSSQNDQVIWDHLSDNGKHSVVSAIAMSRNTYINYPIISTSSSTLTTDNDIVPSKIKINFKETSNTTTRPTNNSDVIPVSDGRPPGNTIMKAIKEDSSKLITGFNFADIRRVMSETSSPP